MEYASWDKNFEFVEMIFLKALAYLKVPDMEAHFIVRLLIRDVLPEDLPQERSQQAWEIAREMLIEFGASNFCEVCLSIAEQEGEQTQSAFDRLTVVL